MLPHIFNELQVRRYIWDVIDANSYLLTTDRHGLLIDAVDSPELIHAVSVLDDLTVILTHCHFDHICGLNLIRKTVPNTTVCSTTLCSENIGKKSKNLSSSANAFIAFYMAKRQENSEVLSNNKSIKNIVPFICRPAEQTFEGETILNWQGHKVKLVQCGGHSKDSLIAILDDRYMFSGDTLLPIPTVTRFPSGSTAMFWEETFPKLMAMTVELVFPGHGEPGKLKDMLAGNQVPERYKVYES